MDLEIVNQSGLPDDQVFVALDTGPGLFPAFPQQLPANTPVPVSSLPASIDVTETFPSGSSSSSTAPASRRTRRTR